MSFVVVIKSHIQAIGLKALFTRFQANFGVRKVDRAAIAKAVEYGLEEGKINFQIVVFSILNTIILEVHVCAFAFREF